MSFSINCAIKIILNNFN